MGELTLCNFCMMENIKRHAERKQLRVITRIGWRGGTDVYLVPRSGAIILPKKLDEKNKEDLLLRKQYWVSWFMVLGITCSC